MWTRCTLDRAETRPLLTVGSATAVQSTTESVSVLTEYLKNLKRDIFVQFWELTDRKIEYVCNKIIWCHDLYPLT